MSESKQIVVLFGATGTVGAYAAVAIQRAGFDVIAVGRRKTDNGFFAAQGMQYVSLDIVDEGAFQGLPQQNVYAVVHLADTILIFILIRLCQVP